MVGKPREKTLMSSPSQLMRKCDFVCFHVLRSL